MLNIKSYLKSLAFNGLKKVTLNQSSASLQSGFSNNSPSLLMADLFCLWYNIPMSFFQRLQNNFLGRQTALTFADNQSIPGSCLDRTANLS